MNQPAKSRQVLRIVIGEESGTMPIANDASIEVVRLTEKNAGDVLEKIFAADAVAVWAPLS
jgi:hypothetical protein